jgi:DNA repair photolyase
MRDLNAVTPLGATAGPNGLRVLTPDEIAALKPELREVIEHRKSGLSLNHIVGCPLDCGYCVRHLFDNFKMKQPRALMSDEDAVAALLKHHHFQPHRTPIQFFNRATDPFLPGVKPHTFRVLELLDQRGLRNHVLVITRWRVDDADCARLNELRSIRLTMLVTHSGIDHPGIEPVDSRIAQASLRTLHAQADRYRVVLYWRPIVPGLNDTDAHLAMARELSGYAHATVFTGLFYRDEMRRYYQQHGLPEPYQTTARRKMFPADLEQRILAAFRRPDGTYGNLYRKTSCGVAGAHEVEDYNGHYGIRELCDICPAAQLQRGAAAHRRPGQALVDEMAAALGATAVPEITDRAIIVQGLSEQPRYHMQHTLGYQVHDQDKPHFQGRHGRAEIGWGDAAGAPPQATPRS